MHLSPMQQCWPTMYFVHRPAFQKNHWVINFTYILCSRSISISNEQQNPPFLFLAEWRLFFIAQISAVSTIGVYGQPKIKYKKCKKNGNYVDTSLTKKWSREEKNFELRSTQARTRDWANFGLCLGIVLTQYTKIFFFLTFWIFTHLNPHVILLPSPSPHTFLLIYIYFYIYIFNNKVPIIILISSW